MNLAKKLGAKLVWLNAINRKKKILAIHHEPLSDPKSVSIMGNDERIFAAHDRAAAAAMDYLESKGFVNPGSGMSPDMQK